MKEEDFLKLSSKEQDQLLAFRQSKVDINESEAKIETQKRWRIVFERALKKQSRSLFTVLK
jgi:hypothetical protein